MLFFASVPAFLDQITVPLFASSAFNNPVPPNAYTRPSLLNAGVPRGPAPPFDSQNRVASRCLHTGSPVLMLYAVTSSSSPRCSCVKITSPRTANDDQPGPIGCRHNATGGFSAQPVSMCTP